MFSFFKKTPMVNIDCFTSNSTAHKFAPIIKASKAKPDWFEKVPKPQKSNTDFIHYALDDNGVINFNSDPTLRTIRSCFGFLELYKKGFVLENWCDLALNVAGENFSYHYSNGDNLILHKRNQIDPGWKDYHLLKLNSPWAIQCKEDISFLSFGAEWSLEKYNFKVLPGILNFHYQTSTNAFLAVPKVEFQSVIPLGHPLIHYIPLTDKQIKIHTHIVTDAEYKTKVYNVTGTSMGWRKTVSLVKRNDKRESKCPFGFGD